MKATHPLELGTHGAKSLGLSMVVSMCNFPLGSVFLQFLADASGTH